MDVLKNRKRKFINLLADGIITHEEYQESIEATNKDLTELTEQKNELLSLMESEDVIETIEKLKKELLQFLNFDELTEDILHRLILPHFFILKLSAKRTQHALSGDRRYIDVAVFVLYILSSNINSVKLSNKKHTLFLSAIYLLYESFAKLDFY
ncbi:hypothetical protein [Ureibacillus thermosphaericus]|uniref:Uncharacterized protein n=1 Tax=Ureibacillus thermosphaericus TaxID=51173 RepID=A0A840PXR7_URETH|nr:hypothetical protein [Ureibacillus thermosphaericus]MBB5149008.1 hypothetical protein [Ureibacillus thermosphaericus]NKZ31730.1 hypothetical protein [Ureibacillus thermosphaericus]